VPDEFDVEGLATGAGEFGVDGAAIIVNDTIVEDEEQLEDMAVAAPVLPNERRPALKELIRTPTSRKGL
jgi:hypothetical protein